MVPVLEFFGSPEPSLSFRVARVAGCTGWLLRMAMRLALKPDPVTDSDSDGPPPLVESSSDDMPPPKGQGKGIPSDGTSSDSDSALAMPDETLLHLIARLHIEYLMGRMGKGKGRGKGRGGGSGKGKGT